MCLKIGQMFEKVPFTLSNLRHRRQMNKLGNLFKLKEHNKNEESENWISGDCGVSLHSPSHSHLYMSVRSAKTVVWTRNVWRFKANDSSARPCRMQFNTLSVELATFWLQAPKLLKHGYLYNCIIAQTSKYCPLTLVDVSTSVTEPKRAWSVCINRNKPNSFVIGVFI